MTPADGPILVTGASGMLGRALCRQLDRCGYEVRALVRRPQDWDRTGAMTKMRPFRFELGTEVDETAFEDHPAALIHCAWAMRGTIRMGATVDNLAGLEALRGMAHRHNCRRLVFVSSLSAHPEALSEYGRDKLRAEQQLDPERDLVVRPGLIIGRGGLFGRMQHQIARRPLVPLFFGGRQQIQHIALEDVCLAVERALALDLSGRIDLAHPDATGIRAFYSAVAASVGRSCRFVRLPGSLTLSLLRGFERQSLFRLPFTSENLLGLRAMRVFDTRSSLQRLALDPLDLYVALARARRPASD